MISSMITKKTNNNITGTPVDNVFQENEGVEDAVVKNVTNADANDEDIVYDAVINDSGSLTSDIDPLQDKMMEL